MAYSLSNASLSLQNLEDILQKRWLLEIPEDILIPATQPSSAVSPEQAIVAQDYLAVHAVGFGPEIPEEIIRLAFILHLQKLINRPSSEIQSTTIQRFLTFYNRDIFPVVLRQGTSTGQLAQLFLPLVGISKVKYQGYELNALDILDIFSWQPLSLHPSEVTSLLRGETFTLAYSAYHLLQLKPFIAWNMYLAAVFIQITSVNPDEITKKATQLQLSFEQAQTAFENAQQPTIAIASNQKITSTVSDLMTQLQACLMDLSNCTAEIFENLISTSEPPATTSFSQALTLISNIQNQIEPTLFTIAKTPDSSSSLSELDQNLEGLINHTEQITALAFWSVSQVGKVFNLAAENITLAAYYHSDLFVPKEMATIQLEKTITFIKTHTPTVPD